MNFMNIPPEKWRAAVEELFSDENELFRKIRKMNSIDTEAALAYVHWVIDNKWDETEMDGNFINEVTGEVVTSKELKQRYEAQKVKNDI